MKTEMHDRVMPRLVSATPDVLARLSNVTKKYNNGTIALDRLNLEIRRGEFVSLLGPSGCGKSTILRLLADLGTVTSGVVEVQSAPKLSATVGYVFQEPNLLPWATVEENVALPLTLQPDLERDDRQEVLNCLQMVGLAAFAKSYPRELSGGMKMRVSIARALVTKPALLLMDEPFAALDEITRSKLDDDMLEIWRRTGCTVVFVTHSTVESVYLSSRIVVMAPRPGRVVGSIDIDAGYPRTGEFRLNEAFAAYAKSVSKLLDSMPSG